MSQISSQPVYDRRRFERFALPAMYTTVRVHCVRDGRMTCLEGHAYDVSAGGMRVELDETLVPGEPVSVEITLPLHLTGDDGAIQTLGRAAWSNDSEDDPGPVRSAIEITRFVDAADRDRLLTILGSGQFHRAA